tara:strand:- start:5 stop:649 length:645 start_codon:yes stop_codon:yes gene_type:complete
MCFKYLKNVLILIALSPLGFSQSLISFSLEDKSGKLKYTKILNANNFIESDCGGSNKIIYVFDENFSNVGGNIGIYAKNIILYLGGHIGASSPNAFLGDSCSSIPPYVHRTYDDSAIGSFELALGIFDILKLDQLNVMSKARLTNFFTLTPFFSYSFDIISIGMNNYYKNFGWGVKLDFKKQGYLLPYIKFEKSSSIFDYNLTTGFSFHFKEVE